MFLRIFITGLLLGGAYDSHALTTPWGQHKNSQCFKEFEELAQKELLGQENFRFHVSSFKKTVYRNLSQKIGDWSEMHFEDGTTPTLYRIREEVITKHSFDKDCQEQKSLEPWPWEFDKVLSKKSAQDWGNEDLRGLVSSGKKGMIYYWSPKFPYSVSELERMETEARKSGFTFTAVVDPRAGRLEVQDSFKALFKTPKVKMNRGLAKDLPFHRNVSTDLYLRSGFNHFPVTFVYANKKIHSRFITGVMTNEGLKDLAQTFVSELEGSLK